MKTCIQILHGGGGGGGGREFCKYNTMFYEKISKEKWQKVKPLSK